MDNFFLCVMFLTLKFVPYSEECHLSHFQGELCNYLLMIFSFFYNVKTVMLLLALSWGALFPCLLKLQRIIDKINTKIFMNLSFHVLLSFLEFLSGEKRGREEKREVRRERRNISKTVCDPAGTRRWLTSWVKETLVISVQLLNLETMKSSEGHMPMVFELKWSLNHLFIFTINNLPAVTCTTSRNGTEGNWLLHCRILSLYVQ